MKIPVLEDYVKLAANLRDATNSHSCKIRVIDAKANHFHFGMYNDHAQHIALICYKDGELSIAPFKSVDAIVREDQFIPLKYFPVANDFCEVFLGLKDFVMKKKEDGNA